MNLYCHSEQPVRNKEETTVLLHTTTWMNLTKKNEERVEVGPEVPPEWLHWYENLEQGTLI